MLNKINYFLFGKISAYPLASFRVLFGSFILVYFLRFLPYIELMFSDMGVPAPYIITNWVLSPLFAWVLYGFTLYSIINFIIGRQIKIYAPVLFFLFLYFYLIDLAVKNSSYDRLIILFLGLMCLGLNQLDGALSVNKPKRQVSAWLTRILCIQVTLFYFGTGVYKLLADPWQNGEILKMTLASNWGSPAAFWLLNLNLPNWFYDINTKFLIYFELICGFAFWYRPVQKIFFLIAFLFHLSVWVFLSIPEFMLCTLTYVLFLPGEEIEAFCVKTKNIFLGFLPMLKTLSLSTNKKN